MHSLKLYKFEIPVRPYYIYVEARSILKAKKKVESLGYEDARFCTIKNLNVTLNP